MLMQTLRKGNHEACSRIPTITFIALRWMAEDREDRKTTASTASCRRKSGGFLIPEPEDERWTRKY